MKIITEMLTLKELKEMAAAGFGDMVKAVVDVERELIAVEAELHADLEALLLENGSKQKDLWGINLYPELEGDAFLEFDSIVPIPINFNEIGATLVSPHGKECETRVINIRPSQGNRSRGVDNEELRKKIAGIVDQRIRS